VEAEAEQALTPALSRNRERGSEGEEGVPHLARVLSRLPARLSMLDSVQIENMTEPPARALLVLVRCCPTDDALLMRG
jgi:hypothetical protein